MSIALLFAIVISTMACAGNSVETEVAAQPATGRNLVANGGFETGRDTPPDGWSQEDQVRDRGTVRIDGETVNSGRAALSLAPNDRNTQADRPFAVAQMIPVAGVAGRAVRVEAALRVSSPAVAVVAAYAISSSGAPVGSVLLRHTRAGNYTLQRGTLQLPAGTQNILVACAVTGRSGEAWFDDVSLIAEGSSEPSGGSPAPSGSADAEWRGIKENLSDLRVAAAWGPPTRLDAPVNTLGWEDSVAVSPDGKTLSFTYLRVDALAFVLFKKTRLVGPRRPGWPANEPFDTYGADIHVSRLINGKWQEPQNIGAPVNLPETSDGDQWLSPDEKRIYFNSAEGRRPKGIYFAERASTSGPWQPVVYLNKNINAGRGDENPHLTVDERTMYFQSTRGGGRGKTDLYVSELVNGEWQQPRNLGAPINTRDDEVQPFVSSDGTTLLFSRNERIYQSKREPNGSWSTPVEIVSGTVGEPTLTDAGDLYFLRVFRKGKDEFDADIMFAPRRR